MDNLEQIADHTGTARGRTFLWGGLVAGILLIVVLYTHGFGLFGTHGGEAAPPAVEHRGNALFVPESSPLRSRLAVAPVTESPVSGRLVLPGTVESDPARTAALLSPGAGRIEEVRVRPGERVAAGDVLLVIDSPDLAQALDEDAKAADTLRLTTRNLERQEGQAKIGAASERDLDQARSDHTQAVAEYARTRTRVRAFGASGGARAGQLVLRAPFAGTVTALNVATGNMLNDPTQPVLTLVHTAMVWVTALAAEPDLGRIQAGEDVQVRLEADPATTFTGKVTTVSDVVEADSHRGKVRIAFDNAGHHFRPNGYADVTLLGAPTSQIVIPTSALLMNNDRTTVFVATAPWTFERRSVEPDLQEGDRVPIRTGLKAGEQVVVSGGILLND